MPFISQSMYFPQRRTSIHIDTGTKMKVSMWQKEKQLFLVGRRS